MYYNPDFSLDPGDFFSEKMWLYWFIGSYKKKKNKTHL